MMRSGSSPAPVPLPHSRLGVEGTGVVDALGPGVTGPAVGEPVVLAAVPEASARGSYAEYTTLPASRVLRRPAGLGVAEAAAVWVGFSTAYGALVETAGMRPGDHVLVTAASGGVGRAALQIAARIGAVPIAVTRDAAKEDDLLAAGAAAVVATDRTDLAEAVAHHTRGAGADIVLDLVGGPARQALLPVARPGGTLVAAGFLDPRPADSPAGQPLTVVGYRSFDHTLDPATVGRMAAFLDEGLRLGAFRPAVDGGAFSLDTVAEAHRRMEQGLHGGRKIVVTAS
jgi:NADPH:quinone reductase-like Zn-dependent oxidoreductase